MRYMILIKHSGNVRVENVPAALHEAMGKFVEQGFKSGVLVDTNGLKPISEGTRVRLAGGKLTVTDGPFTESKEIVGGYAIVKVSSRAEAIENARQFLELHRVHFPGFEAETEVRQIDEP